MEITYWCATRSTTVPEDGCTDCPYARAKNFRTDFPAPEGRKDDTAKLQYHLIPPEALEEVTKVLMFGAEKYGPRNWEKGMAWSRLFDATLRHLIKWFAGEDRDEESGLHHLSHVLCNIMFLVAYVRRSAGTDDRPRVP